jgi:hypothetical protein
VEDAVGIRTGAHRCEYGRQKEGSSQLSGHAAFHTIDTQQSSLFKRILGKPWFPFGIVLKQFA